MVVHATGLSYTTDITDFTGLSGIWCGEDGPAPPELPVCPPYDPWEGANPCVVTAANPTSAMPLDVAQIWFVLGAFPPGSCPRVRGATFGLHYDEAKLGIVAYGPCAADDVLEIYLESSEDGEPFPADRSGVGLAYFPGPRTSHLQELYWFAGYAYSAPPGDRSFEIIAPPGWWGWTWGDDATPPNEDPVACAGRLGFGGTVGYNPIPGSTVPLFQRGDVDGSGELNISDPIASLAYQFAGGPTPSCGDAADDDDSGEINISDPIYSLAYQFAGGPAPAEPFPGCGPDPTDTDPLDCQSFPPCAIPGGFVKSAGLVRSDSREAGVGQGVRLGRPDAAGVSARAVRMPVDLSTDTPLRGFEGTVSYDPRRLRFVRLEVQPGTSFDFFSARDDRAAGEIRFGCVPDFQMVDLVPPGTHRVGVLVFQREGSTGNGPAASMRRARLVTDRLETIVEESGGEAGAAAAIPGESTPAEAASGLRISFPNPFWPGSRLLLQGAAGIETRVELFDASGRQIRGWSAPGRESVLEWDGRTESGVSAPSGVYYLRIVSGEASVDRPLLLLR